MTIGGRHYMPRFQVHRLNNMSSRHAISLTSPPRAMSQTVLKLWCITGGQPRPLSVQIGTQWVWHGQSLIRCGMRRVPVHNANRRWLNHGHVALLERASIDMSFAPPLIVVQVYNSGNFHWVLRLLLIAPTREYLCLKFDPLLDKPHIVGANKEELAVVDDLAEREGIQPQQRRKWATFLYAFGSLAFAIAPLYSTFIKQDDFVSCHPACLLMLHCALSRRVVKGELQVPQDRLWLLREMAKATLYYSGSKLAPTPRTQAMHWEVSRLYPTPKSADPPDTCFFSDGTPAIACHECKVLHCTFHTTVLCQSEICVGLRQFRAALVANAAAVVAFAAVTAANATHATPANANATDDTRPGVWIYRKWYVLPPQYPQNAGGQLENDQAFCRKLHLEKKEDLFERCKLNPTPRGKPHYRDTKADLIFKRVFCNYL